jgi:Mg/Co/Ni transporter MgtE
VLASEISTGHEVGLIVVAAIFIVFALASSFLVPRYKPDFPGPSGLSTFVIVSVVLFALMVLAVNFFG